MTAFEKVDVRESLNVIARRVEAAAREARNLLAVRGDMMTGEAYEAIGRIASGLEAICDDERASHSSGLMCEAVEELKKRRLEVAP